MSTRDGRGTDWTGLVLLWMAGVCLRVTLLAVPPVLPHIHRDLQLSVKAVGALTGLPVLLLGFAAIFGSLLLARLGAVAALHVGLALTAFGGALRGVGTDVAPLFAMTFVMGLGVAVMQPAMPTLAGRWFPSRVGLATAVYVNGLICGEIASAAFTLPVVLPLVGDRWEWSLAFWSLPVALTSAAFVVCQRAGRIPPAPRAPEAPATLWWPDWRDGAMWRIGFILGLNSAIYFGCNAFLPDYMHHAGRPDLVGPSLAALNVGQIPASFLLLAWADRFVGRRSAFAVAGAAAGGGVLALTLPVSTLSVVLVAGGVGFVAAFSLVLAMSLPPIMAPHGDVHRFAAGMLAVGYATAFVLPVIAGALWDATHMPSLAFVVIAAAGAAVVWLALGLRLPTRPA